MGNLGEAYFLQQSADDIHCTSLSVRNWSNSGLNPVRIFDTGSTAKVFTYLEDKQNQVRVSSEGRFLAPSDGERVPDGRVSIGAADSTTRTDDDASIPAINPGDETSAQNHHRRRAALAGLHVGDKL